MNFKVLLTTFVTLFLAELGDKTQLACVLMASKTQRPWTVFLGASLALVLACFLGVVFAQIISQKIPTEIIKKIAAAGFVVMGVLIYFDKL